MPLASEPATDLFKKNHRIALDVRIPIQVFVLSALDL